MSEEELKNDEEVLNVQSQNEEDDVSYAPIGDYSVKYDAPETKEAVIDLNTNQVIDKESLTPFQAIKLVAKQNQLDIVDPNPNCKYCYGRGHLGIEQITKTPVPCSCIFPKRNPNQKGNDQIVDAKFFNGNPKLNRQQKRKLEKQIKALKNVKKLKIGK